MVKGITLVSATASAADFSRLTGLFAALGFERGQGWEDDEGKGVSFLAPIGNLEFATGRMPGGPSVMVEITHLDSARQVAKEWLGGDAASLSKTVETHWGSRMFTLEISNGTTIGFWESDNPLHGRHAAIEGDLNSSGMRFAIVVARWNSVITDRLLQGALDGLLRSGTPKRDVTIVRVPGAWEIPSAARTLAETKKFDAIITLGCLLRGETAHYEAIYTECARGIGQSQQETGVPHAFGILTCETLEQALDRAGLKAGNKGFEAAIAAIEMVSITRKVKSDGKRN